MIRLPHEIEAPHRHPQFPRLQRCGFDAFVFRWNDSLEKLKDTDGYFFGAGFSYEDRGRSGMVAARDPLFTFMHQEAAKGKVIIGNCNGAQVLVESGLIPLGGALKMCLAHNAYKKDSQWISPGFLNEWVWITPACKPDRCATSNWAGALHIPIAHGEGRFVTRDPALIKELEHSGQIAFRYSDAHGNVSAENPVTPNGSTLAIAGICNPAGNVVALMPHPERTPLGDPYFLSVRRWIESKHLIPEKKVHHHKGHTQELHERSPMPVELFIDTIITNNEERTVEQAAKRIEPALRLKQYRYVGMKSDRTQELLSSLSFFNPNKEIAYVRKNNIFYKWNTTRKMPDAIDSKILSGISLLRRDEPDRGAAGIGHGAETGVCYDCREIPDTALKQEALCEVFGNPNASTLEILA